MPILLANQIRQDFAPMTLSPDEQERADQFAAWLIQRMAERGLGVNALHDKSGVAASLISSYRRAKLVPSAKNCIRLAEALHRPLRELLLLAGHPTGDPAPIQPMEIMNAHYAEMTESQRAEVLKYAEWVRERDRREPNEK